MIYAAANAATAAAAHADSVRTKSIVATAIVLGVLGLCCVIAAILDWKGIDNEPPYRHPDRILEDILAELRKQP